MLKTHLFILFRTPSNAVLSQAIHGLTVHKLDGTDQSSAGATVMLVAAWMAEIYMGTDETLLVAQKDHNLCPETRQEQESVCNKEHRHNIRI